VNITGYGQYSKQTAGIRDPKKIMNQQHKLIFIYPMLAADKIKYPNIENLIRDFISVTFLSDLFIENTFNVLNIANQIRPLWDENRQTIDPTSALVRIANQTGTDISISQPNLPNYPVSADYSYTLQQKINQKTAIIQQLVKIDPKFSKLRPFIEIVTLGNMIEVPVIVGTTSYPTDTASLMYVLIAAIGLNKKLSKKSDVDEVFRELETMNETKYWNLLNGLTSVTKDSDGFFTAIFNFFQEKPIKIRYWLSKKVSGIRRLPTLSSAAEDYATRLQKKIEAPAPMNRANVDFSPLFINQTKLQQTKLYFQFVLDSDFAKRRLGIDASSETTKISDLSNVKFGKELRLILNFVESSFLELSGTVGTLLLRSVSNILSVSPTAVNFSSLKSQHIDRNMTDIFDDSGNFITLLKAVDNSLKGSTSEQSRNKIKILKFLCQLNSAEYVSDFSKNLSSNYIMSDDFDLNTYKNFLTMLDDHSNIFSSLSNKIENELKFFISDNEKSVFMSTLKLVKSDISSYLKNFLDEYVTDISALGGRSLTLANSFGYSASQITTQLVPKLKTDLIEIYYFLLLSQLQGAMCKFILTADVDLETVSNEVTAWPNYVLILPVEIMLALHAATMGASWKHMLAGGEQGKSLNSEKNQPLTPDQISKRGLHDIGESYVKGIIKFVSNRLDIPNLVVVDSNKGHIYYKFMNQTDVNKTNISTIETFVQSKLNRQILS